jgi:hypothetical protein
VKVILYIFYAMQKCCFLCSRAWILRFILCCIHTFFYIFFLFIIHFFFRFRYYAAHNKYDSRLCEENSDKYHLFIYFFIFLFHYSSFPYDQCMAIKLHDNHIIIVYIVLLDDDVIRTVRRIEMYKFFKKLPTYQSLTHSGIS